jgi:hypothetical protein
LGIRYPTFAGQIKYMRGLVRTQGEAVGARREHVERDSGAVGKSGPSSAHTSEGVILGRAAVVKKEGGRACDARSVTARKE